jgi:hypothetical protein
MKPMRANRPRIWPERWQEHEPPSRAWWLEHPSVDLVLRSDGSPEMMLHRPRAIGPSYPTPPRQLPNPTTTAKERELDLQAFLAAVQRNLDRASRQLDRAALHDHHRSTWPNSGCGTRERQRRQAKSGQGATPR